MGVTDGAGDQCQDGKFPHPADHGTTWDSLKRTHPRLFAPTARYADPIPRGAGWSWRGLARKEATRCSARGKERPAGNSLRPKNLARQRCIGAGRTTPCHSRLGGQILGIHSCLRRVVADTVHPRQDPMWLWAEEPQRGNPCSGNLARAQHAHTKLSRTNHCRWVAPAGVLLLLFGRSGVRCRGPRHSLFWIDQHCRSAGGSNGPAFVKTSIRYGTCGQTSVVNQILRWHRDE